MTAPFLEQRLAERGSRWLNLAPATAIDLSGDEFHATTTEAVRAATVEAIAKHLGDHYTRRPGIAPLCRAVASYLESYGIVVNPDQEVVIAGGPQEARFVAIRALAPGNTVYVPAVAPWYAYGPVLEFAGAEVVRFDPNADLPDAKGGVLLLPNPNPATGQRYPADVLARIAAWADTADLTVIADETAADLLRNRSTYLPFATLPAMAARTLTLGAFDASAGLAAWQVAWFAGPKTQSVRVRDLKQAMTICSPAASQYAALAGWQSATKPAPDTAPLEALCAVLDEAGLPYLAPDTIASVTADCTAWGGAAAVVAACAAEGVRVMDGAGLGDASLVRFSTTADDMTTGLIRLRAALAAVAPRSTSEAV